MDAPCARCCFAMPTVALDTLIYPVYFEVVLFLASMGSAGIHCLMAVIRSSPDAQDPHGRSHVPCRGC